ncbi:hypothetical protein CBR_g28683 [Chara braunii]|uniref:Uncharacterized protein n=1 Tax=Chara braunii TaxID=69332 RepID=A0A388L9I1_CHABU|nr:hypothetical protein CBR_g28683 [Chara braunii]|eukprot:GBG78969.1 hypothetical protein CBR_g28683 [Chara braunii]
MKGVTHKDFPPPQRVGKPQEKPVKPVDLNPTTKMEIEKASFEKKDGDKDRMDEDKTATGREKRKREKEPLLDEEDEKDQQKEKGKEEKTERSKTGEEEEEEGKEEEEEEEEKGKLGDEDSEGEKEGEASTSESEMSEEEEEGMDVEKLGLASLETPDHTPDIKIYRNKIFDETTEKAALQKADSKESFSEEDFADCREALSTPDSDKAKDDAVGQKQALRAAEASFAKIGRTQKATKPAVYNHRERKGRTVKPSLSLALPMGTLGRADKVITTEVAVPLICIQSPYGPMVLAKLDKNESTYFPTFPVTGQPT